MSIKCQICNEDFKNIGYLHLRTHNISFAEYRKKFPEAETSSKESKEKKREQMSRLWAEDYFKMVNATHTFSANEKRRIFWLKEKAKKILNELNIDTSILEN